MVFPNFEVGILILRTSFIRKGVILYQDNTSSQTVQLTKKKKMSSDGKIILYIVLTLSLLIITVGDNMILWVVV